mmetsp:Transcript_22392/g.36852  ORF Transcript_22392/g.36852 Transcript_22392/m.36852 type:complete len:313 (+) Transcript_22392:49-987(+)
MSSPSSAAVIKSCLDIVRRLDPAETEKHLENLTKLISNDDISDELYQRVDVPLKVLKDTNADDRKFLACDHNRDGDSHRSPWSNMYFPQLEDGFCPSDRLRQLELHANEVFDIYRELYFGKSSSVSSVYLWEKEEPNNNNNHSEGTNNDETAAGFSGAFLIQNKVDNGSYWNSIHVVDVGRIERGSSMCVYRLTTTILISVSPSSETEQESTTTRISGSLIRQNVRECKIISSQDSNSIGSEHIVNIGKFIEDVETEMRKEMDSLYIQKTKNVVEMIRKDVMKPTQGQEHTRVLNEAVLAMAMNRKAKLSGK